MEERLQRVEAMQKEQVRALHTSPPAAYGMCAPRTDALPSVRCASIVCTSGFPAGLPGKLQESRIAGPSSSTDKGSASVPFIAYVIKNSTPYVFLKPAPMTSPELAH